MSFQTCLRRRLLAVSLALATAVGGVTLAQPRAAFADETPPTLTWPVMTTFNPNVAPYTFDVQNAGANLYAVWGNDRQAITTDGPQTMTFSGDSDGTIRLSRCIDGLCTDLGIASPALTVRTTMQLFTYDNRPIGSSAEPPRLLFGFDPGRPGPLTVDWRLKRRTVVALAGTSTLTPSDHFGIESATLVVPVTKEMANGEYTLEMTATADYPENSHLGTLTGVATAIVTVKNSALAPLPGSVPSTIFPVRDGYQDRVSVTFAARESGPLTVDVVNAAGTVVANLWSDHLVYSGERYEASWDGTDLRGRVVPAGRYSIRFTGSDSFGNTASTSRPITVSSKRLVKRTWSRRVTAQGATIGQYVGRCSNLMKPAKKAWKGSQGFRSLKKCTKSTKTAGMVVTTNGIYIRESPVNRYGTAQITLDGGPAKGSTGRSKGHPYIVMLYANSRTDNFGWSRTLTTNGKHAGAKAALSSLIYRDKNGPYIVWRVGLTDGSRFDVRSYTVKTEYYVLA